MLKWVHVKAGPCIPAEEEEEEGESQEAASTGSGYISVQVLLVRNKLSRIVREAA